MSAGHIATVFAHSRAQSVARLVAISLANGYDQEANYAVVSPAILRRETGATDEQVQRGIRQLIRLGEWSAEPLPDGTRVLRMHLCCPIDCDRTPMHRTAWDQELGA